MTFTVMQFIQVSGAFFMSDLHWLCRLFILIERFSYLGISADIHLLSRDEAWGLYLHLSRLADEELDYG